MMEYEMFKEVVEEQILSNMPEEFADYTVRIDSVIDVNKTQDKLRVVPPEDRGIRVIPTISVNRMYEEYQKLGNLQEVLAMSAFHLSANYKKAPQDMATSIMKNVRDKVIMTLINTEQNKELLKTVPHREFCDLSIVYYLAENVDQNSIQPIIIGNQLAEHFGMNEQTLYTLAVENTQRLLPPSVQNMTEVMRELLFEDGMPEETVNMMIEETPKKEAMYVISNNQKLNGAVYMLYENVLHELAERLETDLYILPSSIHEIIALSTEFGTPNELAQMVSEINMSSVSIEERLSNQVYHYDKDLRKVTLATDTPNKRLDGIVAEASAICDTKQAR